MPIKPRLQAPLPQPHLPPPPCCPPNTNSSLHQGVVPAGGPVRYEHSCQNILDLDFVKWFHGLLFWSTDVLLSPRFNPGTLRKWKRLLSDPRRNDLVDLSDLITPQCLAQHGHVERVDWFPNCGLLWTQRTFRQLKIQGFPYYWLLLSWKWTPVFPAAFIR